MVRIRAYAGMYTKDPYRAPRRMTAMARAQENGPDGHGHDPDRRGHVAQAQPEACTSPVDRRRDRLRTVRLGGEARRSAAGRDATGCTGTFRSHPSGPSASLAQQSDCQSCQRATIPKAAALLV